MKESAQFTDSGEIRHIKILDFYLIFALHMYSKFMLLIEIESFFNFKYSSRISVKDSNTSNPTCLIVTDFIVFRKTGYGIDDLRIQPSESKRPRQHSGMDRNFGRKLYRSAQKPWKTINHHGNKAALRDHFSGFQFNPTDAAWLGLSDEKNVSLHYLLISLIPVSKSHFFSPLEQAKTTFRQWAFRKGGQIK